MRYFLVIINLAITFVILSQNRVSFGNKVYSYFYERDSSLYISFYNGEFSVSCKMNEGDDFVVRSELFNFKYRTVKDSIFVGSYVFLINKQGELTSLQSIPCSSTYDKKGYWILRNEKLYPLNYYTEDGKRILYGGKWKNGLKNGKWIYIDGSGKESGVVFKEGVIVVSYIIPPVQ